MNWYIQISSNVEPQAVIDLWVAVGWGKKNAYNQEETRYALDNTSTIIQARNNENELIGLVRVLSDGQYHTVLAEMVVHPDWQKQGLGKALLDKMKEEYSHTPIYLDALPENEKFFAKEGFVHRDKMLVYSIKAE